MILDVTHTTLSVDLTRTRSNIAHLKDFLARAENPSPLVKEDYEAAIEYLEDVRAVAERHLAVIVKKRQAEAERQRKADEERMARPRGPEQAKEMEAKKAEQQGKTGRSD